MFWYSRGGNRTPNRSGMAGRGIRLTSSACRIWSCGARDRAQERERVRTSHTLIQQTHRLKRSVGQGYRTNCCACSWCVLAACSCSANQCKLVSHRVCTSWWLAWRKHETGSFGNKKKLPNGGDAVRGVTQKGIELVRYHRRYEVYGQDADNTVTPGSYAMHTVRDEITHPHSQIYGAGLRLEQHCRHRVRHGTAN